MAQKKSHKRKPSRSKARKVRRSRGKEALYLAIYRLPLHASRSAHDAVEDLGDQTLDEVLETCRATGAKAILHQKDGSRWGWADARGNWSLQ